MKQKDEREYNINRVIKVARELFINEGVNNTSINRIAQEADLSSMSIYRYFNNKDTLVYLVWQDALSTFYKRYMQSMATIQLRLTELHRDRIKARAAELGESVNSYILRLVDEDIERGKAEND